MAAERYRADDFCVEENTAFRWFQGYEGVTPVFCVRALERMAEETPEAVRDKVDGYPPNEQLSSRLYFSGFSDDVLGELSLDDIPDKKPVIEEVKADPIRDIIEPTVPSITYHTTIIPTVMPVDRPKQERLTDVQQKRQLTMPLTAIRLALFRNSDESNQQDSDWTQYALCAQTDPEAFFPEKGGSTRQAKDVCKQCDVRAECLESALKNDERFGIWGGLSERERRKLKKKHKA